MQPRVWFYSCGPESDNTPDHQQMIQELAEKHGMVVAGITVEPSDAPTMNRPGIRQIIDAAERNAVDAVVAFTIKNIGKKKRDLKPFLRIMQENAVTVYTKYQGRVRLPDEVV